MYLLLWGISGLCVGSFINVVIYRLPIMICNKMTNDKSFNLALPCSHCTTCNTPLNMFELIPVFSWLCLKGRCKHCSAKIPICYPAMEVIYSVIFISVGALSPNLSYAFEICFVLSVLLALGCIDIKCMLLPDCLTQLLLWTGIIANSSKIGFTDLHSSVYGAMYGYLILFIPGWLYTKIRNRDGIGHGDYKLLAALGAWFGWESIGATVLIASIVSIFLYLMLYARASKREMPFGPSLIAGSIACQLMNISLWYYPENNWIAHIIGG